MRKKTISFDLSIKMLEQYYPGKDYHQAYRDIQKFMKENGFRHKQFSVYVSKKPMSRETATFYLNQLIKKNPWLYVCIKDVDITSGINFNMKEVIDNHKEDFENFQKNQLRKIKEQDNLDHSKPKCRPMKEVFAEAQKAADEYNAKLGIHPISKGDLER